MENNFGMNCKINGIRGTLLTPSKTVRIGIK